MKLSQIVDWARFIRLAYGQKPLEISTDKEFK